ncbi:MAG: DUF1330 domain-containing protein [Rhodospirillaceae bacterium]|nr:DUF1330 domain-containing protein [Rhodospirillaceae bacterium]
MTPQRFLAVFGAATFMVLPSLAAKAEDVCDKPVDMVILSIVHDVERYEEYRASFIELGTLEEFGGRIVTVATRLEFEPEVLEGEWPDNRHSFVIRWPCAAAAHKFWNSEVYQTKQLPLRVGAGNYDIALFPAIPE